MQFLARYADQFCQPGLDIHVYIFQRYRPLETAIFYLSLDLGQSLLNFRQFAGGKHADAAQHIGMGQGSGDIFNGHALVELDGGGKTLHKGVGGFAEAPTPQFAGVLFFAH